MTLTIQISLDDDAIEQGGAEEIARLLADLCERLPEPLADTNGTLSLHDANGNRVGGAWIN